MEIDANEVYLLWSVIETAWLRYGKPHAYVQGEMSDATNLASLQYNGLIFVTNKAVLKSKS